MNATANTRSPWRTRTTTSTGLRIRPPQINARATFIADRRFPRTMVLLVRFGELALKSRFVRRQLRDRLAPNIPDPLAPEGDECPARGGLPLGSQGRGLALVDSEAGMVAAWLAMKRGCRVTVATPDDSRAHEPLRRWDVHLKVLAWEAGIDVQDLVRVSRSEALFVGSRIGEVEREKPSLDVPLFHPAIGLDDARLRELADRVRSA